MKSTLKQDPHKPLYTRLDKKLATAMAREAASRNTTARAVLESALRDRYDPDRASNDSILMLREIRTLKKQIGRIEFSNKLILEAVTLMTKNIFSSLQPPTKEGRAQGEAFYSRFVETVTKVVTEDRSVLDNLMAELRFVSEDFTLHEDDEVLVTKLE